MVRLLVGCYTKGHEPLGYYTNNAEEGVYVVELNTKNGKLKTLNGPVAAGTNPTYAAFDPIRSIAYFTNENLDQGCVKAFRLDRDSKLTLLNSLPSTGHPCFVAMSSDNRSVLCAHYVSGELTVFPTADDGSLLQGTTSALPADGPYPGKVASRQDKTHAHCYYPLGTSFGLCCDLGTDQLLCLEIQSGTVVDKVKFPAGSGPRHVAVSPDANWVYASTELSNTLVAIPAVATTGKLGGIVASTSLLPSGYDGPATTASHVELSSDGQFAFVGNRVGVPAHDGACKDAVEGTISVIKIAQKSSDGHLTLVECVPIGGKVPRSFCVTESWLIVGAQESSLVRSFSIAPSGKLSAAHDLEIPSPGNIVIAKLKPALRKPKWMTVSEIKPDAHGINLYVKVVDRIAVEGIDEVKVVVGDSTGIVTLRAKGEQAALCEPGALIRIQNSKTLVVKGFITLIVDKWGVLKPALEHEDIETKASNDISAVEYELAH